MQELNNLELKIKSTADFFKDISKDKDIIVVSHFDTDGITSAAIMIKTLRKLDLKFSVKIVKSLEDSFIEELSKDKIIVFLDLASSSLDKIIECQLSEVFIIDHHEMKEIEIPENLHLINSFLSDNKKISASSLTYLFCREIFEKPSSSCANLAIIGMIGDVLGKEIGRLNNGILEESEIQKKRGVSIYPYTRPLNRTLEFCSRPFIPGVTGNIKGVLELLREIGLKPEKGRYKCLMELNEKEMQKLITAIVLRNPKLKNQDVLEDIFLIKFFNKLEDARELSAKINACSRLGRSDVALKFCLEIPSAKKEVESIYAKYKQELVAGLKFLSENNRFEGNGFLIINAQDQVRDTIIGTIASIFSMSSLYEEGTTIVAMAYNGAKIKVSARNAGKKGRNVREILEAVVNLIGEGQIGGHEFAAGANISRLKEKEFIESLKNNLDIEVCKI